MVGRLLCFWDGLISEAMLVPGRGIIFHFFLKSWKFHAFFFGHQSQPVMVFNPTVPLLLLYPFHQKIPKPQINKPLSLRIYESYLNLAPIGSMSAILAFAWFSMVNVNKIYHTHESYGVWSAPSKINGFWTWISPLWKGKSSEPKPSFLGFSR